MYANFFVKLFHIIYYLDQICSIPCKYFNSKITKLRTTSRNDIGYIRYTIRYIYTIQLSEFIPIKRRKKEKRTKRAFQIVSGVP